uniref:Uncharacterized protein n=1 Tax=Anopheles merus TaxID=30066 RepID=A0A182UNN4_ANOME
MGDGRRQETRPGKGSILSRDCRAAVRTLEREATGRKFGTQILLAGRMGSSNAGREEERRDRVAENFPQARTLCSGEFPRRHSIGLAEEPDPSSLPRARNGKSYDRLGGAVGWVFFFQNRLTAPCCVALGLIWALSRVSRLLPRTDSSEI